MRNAGGIIRVSTAKQLEGTSPEKQEDAVRALAQEQGFVVGDGHMWVIAESGNSRDRAGFHKALEAAEVGLVSRVYVFSIDRLGRNLLEMLLFLRELEDLGITCWEAERRRPLASDDFILQIEGAVAGRERREIIRRTQEGRLRSIKAGRYSGGMVAYGFRLNPETKRLQIAEDDASKVRMVFEWCAEEHLTCRQIADRLNAMGTPTHYHKDSRQFSRRGEPAHETSGRWRSPQIQNIIRNTAYMGKWVYGKRSDKMRRENFIEVQCPAIVSPETFNKAADVLQANRWPEPHNRRRQYLLRGLIRCSVCGSNFVGTTTRSRRGDERRYYRCNGRIKARERLGPKCMAKSVQAEALEAFVWNDVKQFVKRPEIAFAQLRSQESEGHSTLSNQLVAVERQIEEHRRRERNLLRVAAESTQVDINALDGVLEEFRGSLASVTSYRDELKQRLSQSGSVEKGLVAAAERLNRLQGRIDKAGFNEKRRAIEALVKQIDVDLQQLQGKKVAFVTVTYRFDEPGSNPPRGPETRHLHTRDEVVADSNTSRPP